MTERVIIISRRQKIKTHCTVPTRGGNVALHCQGASPSSSEREPRYDNCLLCDVCSSENRSAPGRNISEPKILIEFLAKMYRAIGVPSTDFQVIGARFINNVKQQVFYPLNLLPPGLDRHSVILSNHKKQLLLSRGNLYEYYNYFTYITKLNTN